MTWQDSGSKETPHAVYRIYDSNDNLLYVGVTVDVKNRLPWHKNRRTCGSDYDHHDLTWYPSRLEAESAEQAAILTENPRYNIAGKLNAADMPQRVGRPIRMTLDLAPEMWLTLRTSVATAKVGGSAAALLRALIDELQANPDLAARIESQILPAWQPGGVIPEPPRRVQATEKPIRMTLDLDEARHGFLKSFCGGVTSRAGILRDLIEEYNTDPDLAARVKERIRAAKQRQPSAG